MEKKKFLQNNYEQQQLLSMEKFEDEFPYLPKSESKVGMFSSIMFNNNKYYIIKYLNLLISGLLRATSKCYPSPQLVTFKVSDLLRCKCSSREN